jgi:hypothetical protein
MLFLCVISQEFLHSNFCLCELGAAWILDNVTLVPILVPPIEFSDINSLPIRNVQCTKIYSHEGLVNLFDMLKRKELIYSANTTRFLIKLNEFLSVSEGNTLAAFTSVITYDEIISGKIGNSKISLGDLKKDVVREYGLPSKKGTIGGCLFYSYSDIIYYFEDLDDRDINAKILSVGFNCKDKELYKHDIIEILGEPTEDNWSDSEAEWFMTYNIGDHHLYIGIITDKSRTGDLDCDSDSYYAQYLLATRHSNQIAYISLS